MISVHDCNWERLWAGRYIWWETIPCWQINKEIITCRRNTNSDCLLRFKLQKTLKGFSEDHLVLSKISAYWLLYHFNWWRWLILSHILFLSETRHHLTCNNYPLIAYAWESWCCCINLIFNWKNIPAHSLYKLSKPLGCSLYDHKLIMVLDW